MKRFYGIILLFTALAAFKTNLQAQVYPCAGITVAVATAPGGTPTTDYFLANVTLDKTYAEDINVAVTLYQDGNQNNSQTASVTVLAGYLTAESGSPYLGVPIGENAAVTTNSITPTSVTSNSITYSTQGFSTGCAGADVFANGNVLKFASLDVYEQFADNLLDRTALMDAASQSSTLITLEEANPGADDTIYADFMRMILNTDYIVEIGEFLIKIDLANDRALVIQSSNYDAYNSLVNNSTSATGMMVFDK